MLQTIDITDFQENLDFYCYAVTRESAAFRVTHVIPQNPHGDVIVMNAHNYAQAMSTIQGA